MSSINSFNPRRIIVSLWPLCAQHIGQVLVAELAPEYHVSTHTWHPRMFWQHFIMIIGGLMEYWQIWHLNASRAVWFSLGGKVALAVSIDTVSLMAPRSVVNDRSVLPSHLFCTWGTITSSSLSSPDEPVLETLFEAQLSSWMSSNVIA